MGIESMPPAAVPWFYAGVALTILSVANLIVAIRSELKSKKG